MQNLVQAYQNHAHLIEKFILASLSKVNIKSHDIALRDQLYKTFPSLELLYRCDSHFVQNSANIYRNNLDESHIGADRTYLIDQEKFHNSTTVSEPYISTATGYLCITVIYPIDEGYLFLDFRVRSLLERFDLIEKNDLTRWINRSSYALMGGGLIFFGLFVTLYGFYTFFEYLIGHAALGLDTVFKPVIAITLGLAIYDLGKTIFEHEVLPSTQHVSETFNAKTLLNFLVSIIIALFIEALLVVFKISIHDYRDLPYAATFIASLALVLLVFAIFIHIMGKNDKYTKH